MQNNGGGVQNIAIFSPSLYIGGAERAVVSLANGFLRQGKSVHLLLASARGPLLDELDPGIEVVDFGQHRVFGTVVPLSRFLRNHQRLDILFSVQNHANLIALIARRMARVELPVVINEQTTMSMHYAMEAGLKNQFIPKLARLLYHQADAVVCISQGVADDIIKITKIPPEKVFRIYNPVLLPPHELAQKIDAPFAHEWFSPDMLPVLLAVGRLNAAKDYPTLLRAFALAREKREMRLLILGEGEERSAIESLIRALGLETSVHLPGSVDNPYPYMARCSAFVLSSSFEGLGNVLIEAMACGASIVATDCKYGPAEILENGRYGALVPVGGVQKMAEAILGALDGKLDGRVLRERASVFSQENAIQQYLDLFQALHRKIRFIGRKKSKGTHNGNK